MSKATLLRLHRWITLAFALPLAVVIATGLVLSFEPIAHAAAIRPGSLTAARLDGLLARHDPEGQARALTLRPYDDALLIAGARPGPPVAVSLRTGEEVRGGLPWSDLFLTARRLHETLLLDLGRLVVASTYAMLALAVLGVLMGWPRLRNSLSGWHKGVAWALLPLLVASPLTGVFLAHGVTFAGAVPAVAGPAPTPREAIRAVEAAGHDLSGMVWMRPQRDRMLVRLSEGGEWRVHAVTRDGTVAQPRSWPRLVHEGNFAGVWSGLMNVLISLAFVLLLATGLILWTRRSPLFRRRRPTGRGGAPASVPQNP